MSYMGYYEEDCTSIDYDIMGHGTIPVRYLIKKCIFKMR